MICCRSQLEKGRSWSYIVCYAPYVDSVYRLIEILTAGDFDLKAVAATPASEWLNLNVEKENVT